MAEFQKARIDAIEEFEKYMNETQYFVKHGISPSPKPSIVELHGKVVDVLGVWRWPGTEPYAAFRAPGHSEHDYSLCHPKYLKAING